MQRSDKWPSYVTEDMEIKRIDGLEYELYKERPSNLYLSLVNTANKFPDKIGFVEDGRNLTYSKFNSLVDTLAFKLYTEYKIRKGDRVALLMVNSIDFCISFYSIMKLGAVAVTLSTKLKALELIHPLKDSGAKLLILNGQWWNNVKDILGSTKIENCIISDGYTKGIGGKPIESLYNDSIDIEMDYNFPVETDYAVIIYTSGTTGPPKGALLTHFNLLHGIISYKRIFNLSSEDSTIIAIPIFHITGLAALMGLFVYFGGTIYLQPFFKQNEVLRKVEEKKITFFHASPTIFILLLEESVNFLNISTIKKSACGSANMPPEILAKIKKWMPKMFFQTVYGLTETSSPATIFPFDVWGTNKIGSSGIPIPGVYIKVTDDEGNVLPNGDTGELLVKGTVVLQKYWNNENETAKNIKNGWFNTGDLAKIDSDGYLYIIDRKKDMINRGGEKIYSLEIENVLYGHPAVKEAAVVGVPDPVYGEVVRAFIIVNDGYILTEDEVRCFVKGKIAKYKVPQYISFVKDMPRTGNGKISKKILKTMNI